MFIVNQSQSECLTKVVHIMKTAWHRWILNMFVIFSFLCGKNWPKSEFASIYWPAILIFVILDHSPVKYPHDSDSASKFVIMNCWSRVGLPILRLNKIYFTISIILYLSIETAREEVFVMNVRDEWFTLVYFCSWLSSHGHYREQVLRGSSKGS